MFTTTANTQDVRIECTICHQSASGSTARAWASDHSHGPLCTADELVPVGYDEAVFITCTLPRGHAGAHRWIES